MTSNYGIKVSKAGYDVKDCAPNELVFSSKYSTLRVKQQGSGTITHSGGRTITIPHNLGYVPVFLVHSTPDPVYGGFWIKDDYFINPIVPVITGACYLERYTTAWADDTNIYIKVGVDLGWLYYDIGDDRENMATDYPGSSDYYTGWTELGYYDGVWVGPNKGALRYDNVNISQGTTIYKADVGFYIYSRTGSDEIKVTWYGIDEDDTLPFDEGTGGASRTKTSESHNATCGTGVEEGSIWETEVTDIVQEILNREGWSSGNALGFIIDDDGTIVDSFISDEGTGGLYCSNNFLRILPSNNLVNYKYTIFYNKIE